MKGYPQDRLDLLAKEHQQQLENTALLLQKLGISLYDENGNYRNLYDIFEEISNKIENFPSEPKN